MNQRTPLIAANWKMHKTRDEAVRFTEALQGGLGQADGREVVLAPPFTALGAVRDAMHVKNFKLAAQNCHWDAKGAYTGEVSAAMLKDAGCDYVLVGHSERRHLFGETDELVRKKVDAVYREGLLPILCVGEVLDEREEGKTFKVVRTQIEVGTRDLGDRAKQIAIAYEPVWAIGTGKTATPGQAQEVHAFIREQLTAAFDKSFANGIRILYGGSVKPENVDALMAEPDIDGLLVGGASLEVSSFQRIVQYQT